MKTLDFFEVLVREHSQMLMAYIRSAVGNSASADDIWQETMLTAWRRMDDFDRRRPFAPWLRGIAAKHILASQRKQAADHASCDAATLEYLEARCSATGSSSGRRQGHAGGFRA